MQFLSRHLVLLTLLSAVLFYTRLGTARLWDRDEPRNAGCAVEMLERGDWITPYFNDEIRVHKPVLLYWFMISAYAVFGVGEFAARFWSATLAIGTVWMTYFIGRRLLDASAAFWGAAILATSLIFMVTARLANPDSTLIFFTTLATLVYVHFAFAAKDADDPNLPPTRAATPDWFPASHFTVFWMYGLMAIATLAKGPIGIVLPTAVIGMFLLVMRLPTLPPIDGATRGLARTREVLRRMLRPFAPGHFARTVWSMRPWLAVLALVVFALPWYAWVSVRTDGEWTRGFFLEHNIRRAAQPMEGNGGGPWFYPLAILVGFFPWSILLGVLSVSAWRWIRRGDPWAPALVFLSCWVLVYVGVFTIPRTKLATYITPMYPALALLAGAYVARWLRYEAVPDPLDVRLTFGTLLISGVGVAVGIAIAAPIVLGGGAWLGVFGLIPVAGAIVCLRLGRANDRAATATALLATAAVFALAAHAFVAPAVDRFQQSDRLLAAIDRHSDAPRVGSFGRLEPSWVFYLGDPIREIPKEQLADAEAFLEGDPEAFLITTLERYEQLRPLLASDIALLETIPYFARDGQLVVLGRKDAADHARLLH